MIKKVIFTLILCCMFFSCGKKGDPVYKDSKKKYLIENVQIDKT